MRVPDTGLILGVVGLALGAAASVAFAEHEVAAAGTPSASYTDASVGSGVCQKCHPSEYASWHRSFHRTMTRLATSKTVAGPFEGTRVEAEGRTVELSRRGDELWARLPDPDEVARRTRAGDPEPSRSASLVSRRVVLVTGSHHDEVYWVAGGTENELRLVPITYVIAERRFIPRRDAFLQPPDAAPHAVRWNSNCIQCHTTLGRPEHDEKRNRFSSEVTELGIACEACHGAGAAHVQKHQNPLERYASHLRNAPDDSIVNPARLAHDRASELCGQCHAYFVPNDERSWWKDGFAATYRPGDPLERSRTLLAPADFRTKGDSQGDGGFGVGAEADVRSAFWDDGTMRVGGRELNALVVSGCYTRGAEKGRISCLSCHSMHRGEPDDQLRAGDVNAPCAKCHTDVALRSTEHSHHAASSSGNACVGCHMPYTSYALFKGIRSHRIDSPSIAKTAAGSRPNACNLCHLDRTLAWTRETLAGWYGAEPGGDGAKPSAEHDVTNQRDEAFAVELLIAGDAAERAIAAWAFGLPEAHAASGKDWEAPFLAAAREDPYAAVRFMAARSLRTLPAVSSEDASNKARIRALLARRDDRPVSISE